jgi:hypothetical protein
MDVTRHKDVRTVTGYVRRAGCSVPVLFRMWGTLRTLPKTSNRGRFGFHKGASTRMGPGS